jgi:hypothetical protein
MKVEWDAKISDQRINEFLAWRSIDDATVTNRGEIEFRPAPDGRGTEIRVQLSYDPPAGKLGATVAKLFGEAPNQQLRDDLRWFKQVLETGEVVRSEGSLEGTKAVGSCPSAQPSPSVPDPRNRSDRSCEPLPGWARPTSRSKLSQTRQSSTPATRS